MIGWLRGRLAGANMIAVPVHGGGARPPIKGRVGLERRLTRYATVNTALMAMLLALLVSAAMATKVAIDRRDARLFVADGSRFGCEVQHIGSTR